MEIEKERERDVEKVLNLSFFLTLILPIRMDIPQTLGHSILHVPPASPSRHQGSAPPLSCPLLPTLSLVAAHKLHLQKVIIVRIQCI